MMEEFTQDNIILNTDEQDCDSDLELQVAFAKGLIKPGLNVSLQSSKVRHILNIQGLKNKLNEIMNDLPWSERLDIATEPAPLDPQLALQLTSQEATSKTNSVALSDDDFAREMLFYRIAQAGVLEALPRLKKLGIHTKRAEDYFAEMAKSDDHMQKVRKHLRDKENLASLREKAKKLRELKKFGKKVQVERELEKQKEKRVILEQIKKYRKGKTDSLDFLDDQVEPADTNGLIKSKKEKKKELKSMKLRLEQKSKKFGLGAEKRKSRWKRNTAADLDGPVSKVGKLKERSKTRNMNKRNKLGKNRRQKGKRGK